MIRLSIIIPVYNVEQYVGKCLESCLNQDLPKDEYEIIVVNDGSPDNSVEVIKSYIIPENNIRLVNRENGGLSAARNTGFLEAKGEYVWFVDSDDWIEPNILKELIDKVYNDNLDVLCFNLQLVFPDWRKEKYNVGYEEEGKVYSGADFICKVGMPPAAWVALYRRDFLCTWNLQFYEGILHEDQEFTPRAYFLADRISYTDKIFYNYYQRSGSIMKSNRSVKRCKDLLTVADSLFSFMNNNIAKGSKAYFLFVEKVNFAFSQSLAYYTKDAFSLNDYRNKPYYPLKGRLTYKYRLINFSLTLYLLIYRLKNK